MSTDDMGLLKDYARHNSEEAFAALVSRHVNLVYSVALRQTGDAAMAEEITQAVFVILARKADSLGDKTILPGWLCRTARNVSANALTIQRRRQRREQEAYMQTVLDHGGDAPSPSSAEPWAQIAPLLDAALGRLGGKDHDAIVLRFIENKQLKQVGAALGVSEDAAKKRVGRALEKLRRFFLQRGLDSTTAAIAETISANSIQIAPSMLAKAVTAVALTKGAAPSVSTLTLIRGALKIMAWTKAKTGILVAVGLLLAVGTTTVTIKKVKEHKAYLVALDSWRVSQFKPDTLTAALPQTRILPTKFRPPVYGARTDASGGWVGVRAPVRDIVRTAYDWPPGRILFPSGEPKERYDFAATMPEDTLTALQQELKQTLGLVARPETRETGVLLLRVQNPGAPGLKPHGQAPVNGLRDINGRIISIGLPISMSPPAPFWGFTRFLELYLEVPVIDETGLTGRYDIDIKWNERNEADPGHDAMKKVLLDQLGLELVPASREVEMLVVEKVK